MKCSTMTSVVCTHYTWMAECVCVGRSMEWNCVKWQKTNSPILYSAISNSHKKIVYWIRITLCIYNNNVGSWIHCFPTTRTHAFVCDFATQHQQQWTEWEKLPLTFRMSIFRFVFFGFCGTAYAICRCVDVLMGEGVSGEAKSFAHCLCKLHKH